MKLLTWNVQWCRGIDGRVDPERIARTALALADFDVLCLQEVAVNFHGLAGSAGEDQIAELSARLPGYRSAYVAATDVPHPGSGRSRFGNAVFSRLPIGQIFRHLLPWRADARVPAMQRALLEVVVTAPWGPLRVMTTHLEYYSAEGRMAQVESILEKHREACDHAANPRPDGDEGESMFAYWPRPASAVFTGDMNFRPTDPEHARILGRAPGGCPAFRDTWEIAHPGTEHDPTLDVHELRLSDAPYCSDYIFVTEDLAPRVANLRVFAETDASDHQPVLLELSD